MTSAVKLSILRRNTCIRTADGAVLDVAGSTGAATVLTARVADGAH